MIESLKIVPSSFRVDIMKKKFKIGYGKTVKMEFLFSVVAKEKSVHGKADFFWFAIQCFY